MILKRAIKMNEYENMVCVYKRVFLNCTRLGMMRLFFFFISNF